MIATRRKILANGGKQTAMYVFTHLAFAWLTHRNGGWFRILNVGVNWVHNRVPRALSERIGKHRKYKVGNYRIGLFKAE